MTEIWNSWWGFIENWDISKVSLDILQSRVPRKLVLLIAAVIVSYLCVDPVISSWFYPEYDVDHYMLNLDILNPKQGKIYKPYARLYSDESGLITQKNNHGLPGYNIYPHTGINILIMGDSFVEAIEVPREQHFSYLTQVWLHRKKIDAQLINVGSRNHDPLAQYVRCQYYANRFQPDYLIYVIETPVYTDGFLYDAMVIGCMI